MIASVSHNCQEGFCHACTGCRCTCHSRFMPEGFRDEVMSRVRAARDEAYERARAAEERRGEALPPEPDPDPILPPSGALPFETGEAS